MDRFALRAYIAGKAGNTPPQLIQFLQHAREVLPGGAMPMLDVTEGDARDLAAFLYTLQ